MDFVAVVLFIPPWAGTGTQNLERAIQVLDLPLLPK